MGKITLVENDAIISDDKEIAKTMNQCFINITKKLDLKRYKNSTLTEIDSIASNFGNHRSIKKMLEYFPDISYADFDSTEVSLEDVEKEILILNVKNSQLMVPFQQQS